MERSTNLSPVFSRLGPLPISTAQSVSCDEFPTTAAYFLKATIIEPLLAFPGFERFRPVIEAAMLRVNNGAISAVDVLEGYLLHEAIVSVLGVWL